MNKLLFVYGLVSYVSAAGGSPIGETNPQGWNMAGINKWILPDIMVAIWLVLSLFLLFLVISCQLMAVQSQ